VLKNPVLRLLQGGKDLVPLRERTEAPLHAPLPVQVRFVVRASEMDQNGHQGAIHQHHLPLFI
jgi:hypothetical protein